MIIKLKNLNFTIIKFFLEDVDIDSILICVKLSSGEKNCRCFIGCMDDDYKMKPFIIIFPKLSAYIESFDGETKWMYFLVEDDELLKNRKDGTNSKNKISTNK